MKITDVEAIYPRQAEVREQCDSGQDALVVRVSTDAGITGIGEVDSAPMAVKGAIEGPYSHTVTSGLKHLLIGRIRWRPRCCGTRCIAGTFTRAAAASVSTR